MSQFSLESARSSTSLFIVASLLPFLGRLSREEFFEKSHFGSVVIIYSISMIYVGGGVVNFFEF